MKCPLCDSESKFAFEAKGYPLRDCLKCGHRFAEISNENHVEEVYDDSYFMGGGAGYSDYLAEGEMLQKRGKSYAAILRKYAEAGSILDIGSAAGFILKGLTDEGWIGYGIEPNPSMAEYGIDKLGLEILTGDFESFATNEKFDLISMIQVAAHFHQPRKAFGNASGFLRQDGLLLIESWDRDSFSARIFGKNWHEYSPPSVLHWYSLDGLSKFLEEFGFEKIASGRPSKKISGEHARSLLRYRLGDNFLLKLIPGKVNFPYPAEDLFWALYQKKK